MIKPRALGPGARIAVVSTASVCSREDFELGIAELRRLGYEPTYNEVGIRGVDVYRGLRCGPRV